MLRLFYVASVATLACLALATLASPMVVPLLRGPGQETTQLTDSRKLKLIERADEWIVQYELMNDGAVQQLYTFEVLSVPAAPTDRPVAFSTSTAFVDPGKGFVFISHVYPSQVASGKVRFVVRRDADPEPIEDVTLFVGGDVAPVRTHAVLSLGWLRSLGGSMAERLAR